MSKILRSLIAAVGLAGAVLLPQAANANPVTLTFEGIANGAAVGAFYDQAGACDPNNAVTPQFGCGINFANAFAFTGDATAPSPDTVASNIGCTFACIMELTSDSGFNGSVSLWHSGFGSIVVEVFAASDLVNAIGTGTFGGPGFGWTQESVGFLGVGSVVRISSTGGVGSFSIDDVGLDLVTGGGGNVPEPATFALVALALVGAASATRRRRG